MLKALIVDDEIASFRTLEVLVGQFISNVQIVDIARSAAEALDKVERISPDLVFLDIEMPGGDGFDFLERCAARKFEVIFITAYNRYAIRAFRYSAIDYLLKPIDVDELRAAVERAIKRRYANFDGHNKYYALFENLRSVIPSKLVVTANQVCEYINLNDVCFLEDDDKMTRITFTGGNTMRVENQLSYFEEILGDRHFYRINSQQLVNMDHIRRIFNRTSDNLELDNGTLLAVDVGLKAGLERCLEKYIKLGKE